MDYKQPRHPHDLLHTAVRVIEERAVLMQVELIDEHSTGGNRILREAGYTVHRNWKLDAVPVHYRGFRQLVVDNDAHPVAIDRFNSGPGMEPLYPQKSNH